MRAALFTIAIVSAFVGSAFGQPPRSANQTHIFYGKVVAIDRAAQTFTIDSAGRPLVFHYHPKTRISSFRGHVSWDTVRPGHSASVTMRLGPGNIGIAERVRFDEHAANAEYISLIRAVTVGGETVTGVAVGNYIAHEPPSDRFSRATEQTTAGAGVFVLNVRPDGTVGEVSAAKSLPSAELNQRAAAWLKQWRFRPGSVQKVQMPVGYQRLR